MRSKLWNVAMFAVVLNLVLCGAVIADELNTLTEAEQKDGWQLLFNGKDLSGWKGYRQNTPADKWIVENESLFLSGKKAGHILTSDTFSNFDFRLEWKVEEGGNSGVFFRATENTPTIWHNAIEMQVLDNEGFRKQSKKPENIKTHHCAGACYALYDTVESAVKPAGEWNEARILAQGSHIQFWLNGIKTADFVIGSDDWKQRVANSKYNSFKTFAMNKEGHIGLQDHGSKVWYRNIKIKKL